MFSVLQIITVLLVAMAMAFALAHALELPGKLRLDKKAYYAVQSIHYPGFTVGGIGEVAGTIAAIILLFLTPRASVDFWLTRSRSSRSSACKENRAAAGFFAFGTDRTPREKNPPLDWTSLRNRWEYSHVARAACAMVSFVALIVAISPIA
jgi:hypothetical protein